MESHSEKRPQSSFRELTARELAKTIFRADLPEQYIRTFPAQSLYISIKHNSLQSSVELVELATIEQVRLFLDFDLWNKDQFNEENLWEWLTLADDENGLKILQRIVKCIDLKLVALLIARHVTVEVLDEPTEQPPQPGFFTPDQGSTWIAITLEDGTKHFLLGRLLALVFETSPELFYQLIGVAQTQTATVLEEEAFQDRTRRLVTEGVPDSEYAHSIHAPLFTKEIENELKRKAPRPVISDIRAIEPLVFEDVTLAPLRELYAQAAHRDDFQAELTLIMNAALVYFNVDFADYVGVSTLLGRVRGAINIGIESTREVSPLSPFELYEQLGLQKLYRLGLSKLLHLGSLSRSMNKAAIETHPKAVEIGILVECLAERFPALPLDFKGSLEFAVSNEKESSTEVGEDRDPLLKISPERKPFEHLNEYLVVKNLLSSP